MAGGEVEADCGVCADTETAGDMRKLVGLCSA